jgi:hypothetical protein
MPTEESVMLAEGFHPATVTDSGAGRVVKLWQEQSANSAVVTTKMSGRCVGIILYCTLALRRKFANGPEAKARYRLNTNDYTTLATSPVKDRKFYRVGAAEPISENTFISTTIVDDITCLNNLLSPEECEKEFAER